MKIYESGDFKIFNEDCFDVIRSLDDNSVDLVVTDPPYFLDGMGDDWDSNKLKEGSDNSNSTVIGGLPVGMGFNKDQGKNFQKFMGDLSIEILRVLKPGGYFISFSQARLVHRLGVGIEDAGFEIRDMLSWKKDGQPKAFKQDHFVRKMKISDKEKEAIIKSMGGRKTPQLAPQNEPMILAQKPREGTFVQNWMKWGVGLVDTTQTLDGKFPGTVIEVKRPSGQERKDAGGHLTVKPVALIEHLIRLFSKEGQVVLDPFLGSGTAAVACKNSGRKFVGSELSEEFFNVSITRINNYLL